MRSDVRQYGSVMALGTPEYSGGGRKARGGGEPGQMDEAARGALIDYLQRAQALDLRIDAAFERINQLRALAERRTAVYGRERTGGSMASDGRMDVVACIVDAERALDLQIDHMLAVKKEIAGLIAQVPDERMRGLLELRYLNGLTWEAVAERMHYTTRNVYNLHIAALKVVAILHTGLRAPREGAQAKADPRQAC